MFSLSVILKNQKQPKWPSIGKCLNCTSTLLEYCVAVQKNIEKPSRYFQVFETEVFPCYVNTEKDYIAIDTFICLYINLFLKIWKNNSRLIARFL